MNFVYQTLTWGFLIALVPVLIHLINLMRHRRVKWAAMDFLLQSYKKHRSWIWMKQLLLLLLRMLAIALVVAMLAKWVTRDQWFSIFGGRTTHHYVLLDDSYSMSERMGGTTAFEIAKQAVSQIALRAMEQDSQQRFTLIRYSQATSARNADQSDEANAEQVADLNAALVDADFDVLLEEKRNTFEVSQLALSPRPALELIKQLLDQGADEHRLIYVVSDFRAREWENPGELRPALRQLEQQEAQLHLVRCVQNEQPNLAIVDLQPSQETRAAGVPLFVNVSVRNWGQVAARRVQLKTQAIFFDPEALNPAQPDQWTGDTQELPTVVIDEIAPGATATRQIQVYFPEAGQHVVEARLPEDPVAADNQRWCVIDFPEGERVLIVDGAPGQQHAYYLTSAFQPGSRANTGIRPDVQTPSFLRDTTLEGLLPYRSVYLLNVPRLDERAVQNLESYVEQGGGLGIFVGDDVNLTFYNDRLHRNGQGLFPVPLQRVDLLPPSGEGQEAPDIVLTDHPIFRVFAGQRNPLIRLVSIERYVRTLPGWSPPPDSSIEIVARLRNQMPLVVERAYGAGRVVACLTTLAPQWNNWAGDPTFVVVMLKLQSHLAAPQRGDQPRLVGTPIDLQLDAKRYRSELSFATPGANPATRIVIKRTAAKPQPDSLVMLAALGRGGPGTQETAWQGVYEAWPQSTEGSPQVRRWALNVDPEEGNLALADNRTLLDQLDPVAPELHDAGDFVYAAADEAGFSPSLWLMGLLVLLLLGEQVMGYLTSYHPARGAVR